jgi:hypothetical protein
MAVHRIGPRPPLRAAVVRGVAAVTIRPLTDLAGAAGGAGMRLERRTVDRLIESGEVERVLASGPVQTAAAQLFESDGARRLIDAFFDSGLFDRLVDRLLASEGLWELIDRVASSPAVAAAVAEQGRGFADLVGDGVRTRSRDADAWLERLVRRLVGRGPLGSSAAPDPA